jgi:hypothetical protein
MWQYLLSTVLTGANENIDCGFKKKKDLITVLVYVNVGECTSRN